MSFFQRSPKEALSPSAPKGLRLYDMKGCYYCALVRKTASRLGIPLDVVDTIENDSARQLLIERLGRSTVPVLGIPTPEGERLLPESADIVRYLEDLNF